MAREEAELHITPLGPGFNPVPPTSTPNPHLECPLRFGDHGAFDNWKF